MEEKYDISMTDKDLEKIKGVNDVLEMMSFLSEDDLVSEATIGTLFFLSKILNELVEKIGVQMK